MVEGSSSAGPPTEGSGDVTSSGNVWYCSDAMMNVYFLLQDVKGHSLMLLLTTTRSPNTNCIMSAMFWLSHVNFNIIIIHANFHR